MVVAGVDTVGILGSAVVVVVVVVAPDMVDIAGFEFVEVGMVGIVVAAEFGIAEAAVAAPDKIGIADVDRHKLVVRWQPSYIVAQFVVGFLNSH